MPLNPAKVCQGNRRTAGRGNAEKNGVIRPPCQNGWARSFCTNQERPIGNATEKVAPRSGLLAAHKRPP
jgi:hypothetical protein